MFDFLVIAYVLVAIVLGVRFGLFRRAIHLIGFYIGLLVATATSPALTQLLGWSRGDYPAASQFTVFLATLILMVLVFEVLGAAYAGFTDMFRLPFLDSAYGGAAGALMGLMELAAIVYLFNGMVGAPGPSSGSEANTVTTYQRTIDGSWALSTLKRLEGISTTVFMPVLPPSPHTYFSKSFV